MKQSIPIRRSHLPRRPLLGAAALTGLGLVGLVAGLLTGCGSSAITSAAATANYSAATGNWRFTTPSAHLAEFAGALSVSGSAVTGTLHPVAGTCIQSTSSFPVTGSVDSNGVLSLTSTSFPGGTVAVSGTLAADRHSLTSPTITVTGGSCALVSTGQPSPRTTQGTTAQQYQPITGTYAGTLTSSYGGSLAVSTTLSQATSPDSNGVYHLTGNATFSDTTCINAPAITDATVSGNAISTTYTDPNTGNSVTGNGTFSSDATTLTITSWTLSGSCGNDTGTGAFTRQ